MQACPLASFPKLALWRRDMVILDTGRVATVTLALFVVIWRRSGSGRRILPTFLFECAAGKDSYRDWARILKTTVLLQI
jgi:hypothetical protein